MPPTCLVHMILVALAAPGVPRAGDDPSLALSAPTVASEEPRWRFDAFIYYWSASLDGELTVDGDDVDLDGGGDGGFSGDPALTGFLGHFEASRGPWSFAVAPIFVNVSTTGDEEAGAVADIEIHAQIHEAFAAHEIGGAWQWLAGARYYDLETDVSLTQGGVPVGALGSNRTWVDPIVGVRYHQDLGEHWSLRGRADVGGFGVGSELSWNASALVGYGFTSSFAAHFGYRALYVDFEQDSGSDRVEYDLTMYGPILGISFSF